MLGQRLMELRMACGITQVELAKKLGVAKQTVSNWENDNIQPSIEMLVRIAAFFHVSTDYLLGLDEMRTLTVNGLPPETVAHLALLIEDFGKLS